MFRDAYDVYHSEDEQFFKIERDANDDSWTVWDKSGTKYTFGHQTRMYFVSNDGGSCTLDDSPWRWSLSKVEKFRGQVLDARITLKLIRLLRDGRAVTASYARKYPSRHYDDIVKAWVDTPMKMTAGFCKYHPKTAL